MLVRVGYGRPDSWWRGIRYAVDHGARVLVIPHGYIGGEAATGTPLFYQGTDFAYPSDNPKYREALDYACDQGCLIARGTADNRGRRAVSAMAGIDAVMAAGSANRHDEPANICCSADYVEIGTPGGQRRTEDPRDHIWGCGGDRNYIPFEGGCMASGFAGAAAALTWSRFPGLSNDQVRQILRNTARPARGVTPDADGWEPKLGYGIVDVGRAVSVKEAQLCRDVRVVPSSVGLARRKGGLFLEARLENRGGFDAERAVAVVYNGDPTRPVDRRGSFEKPSESLMTKQIGHAIARVRGCHGASISVALVEPPKGDAVWIETFCLDRHDEGKVNRVRHRVGL